jgi:hypothetical protein
VVPAAGRKDTARGRAGRDSAAAANV